MQAMLLAAQQFLQHCYLKGSGSGLDGAWREPGGAFHILSQLIATKYRPIHSGFYIFEIENLHEVFYVK